jgi:4-hydroxybenzoate polyprenyltransferase
MARGGARKDNRRLKTFLWIAAFSALIIGLLYYEQAAILYLLATLGLTGLLVVVAMSDLDGSKRAQSASALGDDSAAIGDALTGATAAAAVPSRASTARRAAANRK